MDIFKDTDPTPYCLDLGQYEQRNRELLWAMLCELAFIDSTIRLDCSKTGEILDFITVTINGSQVVQDAYKQYILDIITQLKAYRIIDTRSLNIDQKAGLLFGLDPERDKTNPSFVYDYWGLNQQSMHYLRIHVTSDEDRAIYRQNNKKLMQLLAQVGLS